MPMFYHSEKLERKLEMEYIAATYSTAIMLDLLREDFGWDGLISTDWNIHDGSAYMIADHNISEIPNLITNPFGQGLTLTGNMGQSIRQARLAHVRAHQLGNARQHHWLNAYIDGLVTVEDIRLLGAKNLELTFRLGLFENPYIEWGSFKPARQAGQAACDIARMRALVLLKNRDKTTGPAPLPLVAASNKKFFYDGVTSRTLSQVRGLLEPHGVNANDVVAPSNTVTQETAQREADVQIIRVTTRRGNYWGLAGGVPISFDAPVRTYSRRLNNTGLGPECGRHEHELEWLARIANAAADNEIAFNRDTRVGTWNGSAPSSNIVHDIAMDNARLQGAKLFNAIERKKNANSHLIVIINQNRPFIFGSRYTGEEVTVAAGPHVGKKYIREVSTIKRYTTRGWAMNAAGNTELAAIPPNHVPQPGGTLTDDEIAENLQRDADRAAVRSNPDNYNYNGTNLYIPENIDRTAAGFNHQAPHTWQWKAGLGPTEADNPIELVKKLLVGGLTRTEELPNGVTVGTFLYVDPVAAEGWVADLGSPTGPEIAALRQLQFNHNAALVSGHFFSINPLVQIEFIDDPLDYIDGLIIDYGITDNVLVACLFNKAGNEDAGPYAPSATLPNALYWTDMQVENQWEDLPFDLPTKNGYIDHHGFMFGYRAGLMNWEKGIASSDHNFNWTWPPIVYPNSCSHCN